jgi:serine/threonine-protein kinase RsbW
MSEAPDRSGAVRLSLPALETSLDSVHDAIERLWSDHESVALVDRMRFETAVVEIFANIVEHAFRSDPTVPDELVRRLELTLEVTEDRVAAWFADNGVPAELDLSAVTLPSEDAESGRGLAMALAAVDDLEYHRVEGRNHWSLVCRRRAA